MVKNTKKKKKNIKNISTFVGVSSGLLLFGAGVLISEFTDGVLAAELSIGTVEGPY